MPASSSDTTRQRILDAAEQLFAERGLGSTSLRAITTRAAVNLAAVSYHFGSKNALIEAVFERRLQPLNQQRMERLQRLEQAAHRGQPAGLEALLIAFIEPALVLGARGVPFVRLLGRSYGEADATLRESIHRHYRPILERYTRAVGARLPQLPDDELRWRLQFLLGAMSYSAGGIDLMRVVADCKLSNSDDRALLLQRLVTFLAAGLRAPPSMDIATTPAPDTTRAAGPATSSTTTRPRHATA